MTNKEFYQSVFSQVHPAAPVTWEGCRARSRRARRPRRLLMAAAVAAVLLALSCAAVAVNFLGLRDLLLFPDREGAGDTAFQRVSLSGYMGHPGEPGPGRVAVLPGHLRPRREHPPRGGLWSQSPI